MPRILGQPQEAKSEDRARAQKKVFEKKERINGVTFMPAKNFARTRESLCFNEGKTKGKERFTVNKISSGYSFRKVDK